MHKTIVAIVGKPNVGKSTLFNRLIGRHTAITEDFPGVTRDRIYGVCSWLDKTFTVIDTGGLMPVTDDPMLSQMQLQTHLAIEEADVIICLLDGHAELTTIDYEVVKLLRQSQKPVYYVVNKIDSPKDEARIGDFYRLGMTDLITISAEHKLGLNDLLDQICEHVEVLAEEDEAAELVMRIAVVGRPNVGKSSLVNFLLGKNRMLVTDIPGTTRDAIDSDVYHNGSHYIFVDTSGIRRKSKIIDPIERYSVVRAFKSIDRCHLVFLMLDATAGVTDQDAKIAGYAYQAGRAILLIVNKWDLMAKDSATAGQHVHQIKEQLKYIEYAPIIFISALTGQRALKTLTLADDMFAQYNRRIPTAELNAAVEDLIKQYHPPAYKGRPVKFYYGTQTTVRPPTFVLFCNYPDGVPVSYQRYLTNQLRERFQFTGAPLQLRIQQR